VNGRWQHLLLSANVGRIVLVLLSSPGVTGVEVKPAHVLVGVVVAAGTAGAVEPARARRVVEDDAPSNRAEQIEGKAGVVVAVCAVGAIKLAALSCHPRRRAETSDPVAGGVDLEGDGVDLGSASGDRRRRRDVGVAGVGKLRERALVRVRVARRMRRAARISRPVAPVTGAECRPSATGG
jgi:hypothetical protein